MHYTSIHTLNADKKLNFVQKRLWFLFNYLNNLFPSAGLHDIPARNFLADISEEQWNQTNVKSSPSRKLSDLFWQQLPWQLIATELKHINIFDTGCGSGNYGIKLNSYSKGHIGSYTGIDLSQHDNWNTLTNIYPNFQFRSISSDDILNEIPFETNFIISQSAIEHFEHDLYYFEQIREFIGKTSKNTIQIHLFPSSSCLKLYGRHGVRQYTPRTISKITRLFQGFSYSLVYELGGRECNSLHWEFITKPLSQGIGDLRETQTHTYDKRLRQAIVADGKKSYGEPSFYALVIHSNWKNMIFM